MRLVIISNTGYAIGLATRLSSEGHAVTTYSSTSINSNAMSGILSVDNPDITIFDSHAFANAADYARSKGCRVLGTSPWASLVDSNSSYRISLIKAIGYPVAPAGALGTEIMVVCWSNGNRIISSYLAFNYTHLMSGDVGVEVESAGYIAYFPSNRLASTIAAPLSKYLRKANHRGCFNIKCLVTDAGDLYVTDISANTNAPYTNAIYANTRKSVSDIMLSVMNESSDTIPFIDPYVCGILLSVYPYPYARPATPVEVVGLNPHKLKHLWRVDCAPEGVKWLSGSMSGCLGYITGRGIDYIEARRRAYRTISDLIAPNLQYRNDIGGSGFGEKVYRLHKLGLAPASILPAHPTWKEKQHEATAMATSVCSTPDRDA